MSPDFIRRATVTGHLHFNGAPCYPMDARKCALWNDSRYYPGGAEQRRQLRYVCGFSDIVPSKYIQFSFIMAEYIKKLINRFQILVL